MSHNTEQRSAQQAQAEPGASKSAEVSEVTRPAGTVDEDANPPLTDPTTTEVDRNPDVVPPRDTGEGRATLRGTHVNR